MAIEAIPELGVAVPNGTPYMDLRDRAAAACKTLETLEMHGLSVPEPNDADKEIATALTHAYAEDPEKTSKAVTQSRSADLTPASLVLVRSILDEFGTVVVESSVRIRNLVTNKLLLETENPDPRIRLRALELLGKISDVGLFSDKSEITVTHKSSEELKNTLRSKLAKLVSPEEEIEEAEFVDSDKIDVAEEFGFDDE